MGELKRTRSTDGRQSWIRDGINTAAITRLWQIYRLAHSEPLLRWSPSFRSIPADTMALINMQTSAVSCLAQLSFSWHFHRNIQGYCRIIRRLRKQCLEYHEWMHGVRFSTMCRQHVGVCKHQYNSLIKSSINSISGFWIRLIRWIWGLGVNSMQQVKFNEQRQKAKGKYETSLCSRVPFLMHIGRNGRHCKTVP